MTTIHRVHNFSAGPAVMPLTVLEGFSATSWRCLALACRFSRSATGRRHSRGHPRRRRSRYSRPRRHSIQLQGAVPSGWRGSPLSDEVDEVSRTGADRRLHRFGSWADKAIKEAKKVGTVNVAATTKAIGQSTRSIRARADARRRVRPHDVEQHDRRHRIQDTAGGRGCCRSSATRHPTCSAGRLISAVTR